MSIYIFFQFNMDFIYDLLYVCFFQDFVFSFILIDINFMDVYSHNMM